MSNSIPSGAKRKRAADAAEPSSSAATTESQAGATDVHVLKKSSTVLQRVVFALRKLGTGSSAVTIIKACSVHCDYHDAAFIRKAIKTGTTNGTLQVSATSAGKVWIAGEAEPEGEKPIQVTIEEGLAGTGPACKPGDFVGIDYELYLAGPPLLVASAEEREATAAVKITRCGARLEKGKSFTFQQAAGEVIKGMDAGVLGLCPGGTRTVFIPWELGCGRRGSAPSITPCADVVFDIKLLYSKSK